MTPGACVPYMKTDNRSYMIVCRFIACPIRICHACIARTGCVAVGLNRFVFVTLSPWFAAVRCRMSVAQILLQECRIW